MPFLLITYLLTEMLAPFFASFIIINAVLFLGRLMSLLDVIFGFGIDLEDFIRICAYLLPNLMLFSIPMASTLAVILAFTRLTSDNEILALKAAGIGAHNMLIPVIIFALCTSAFTAFSATTLIPSGTVAMKKLLFQLAKEKVDKGLKEKEFNDSLKDVVLYIDRINTRTDEWSGVYVSDMRQKKESPVIIIAESGNLEADFDKMLITLSLREGSMHRSMEKSTQTIGFSAYTLKLPVEPPRMVAGDPATQVGKRGMSLSQLLENSAKKETTADESMSLLIEFHKRLAMPVGCFILTLLGLPLAMQSRPGHKSIGLPFGLGFFILYYILITAAKTMSENGTLPVWLAMWLPNVFFGITAYVLIRIAVREHTIALFDKLLDLSETVINLFRHRRGEQP